jgi:hypothetical protein
MTRAQTKALLVVLLLIMDGKDARDIPESLLHYGALAETILDASDVFA